MDAGLRDDAEIAKSRLVNEIQRGDMARGGPTVSPDLNARGDERVFKGAKVAIERGMLLPSDLELIKPHLSETQITELQGLMAGSGGLKLSSDPAGMADLPPPPAPDLSSAMDAIEGLPEFQRGGVTTAPTRVWMPEPDPPANPNRFRKDYGLGGIPAPQGEDLLVPPPLPPPPPPVAPQSKAGLSFGLPGAGQTAGADLSFGLPAAEMPGRGAPQASPGGAPVPPAEDPIIQIAGSASTKGEALAVADEAEASGLFPGARAKVMDYFGWDEDGADDAGSALMNFGIGLLQGGADFSEALGNGFAKGAEGFTASKDRRRQAALEDRRIAIEDERLDYEREEMDRKRKQAAIERLTGQAQATQSGLIYYEDEAGNIRSTAAPLSEGPEDSESMTDLERLAYITAMDDADPMKQILRDKWFPPPKSADPLAGLTGV
jgi:hypothetical protein